MKKITFGLTLTVVAAAAYLAYGRWSDSANPPAPKAAADQAVGVVPVQIADVPVRLDLNGTVVALKTVEVRSQAANVIKKIHVSEGQFVKRGELLFSLDDRADRANFEKVKAQLARDQAVAADYLRQFKRAQELRAQNFIAQSALDASQAQYEAQLALLRADEAALQAAQVALDYDSIAAPQSGRLGGINVFAGSLVQPSSPALVTITQIDPIAVQFNIPESNLAGLQRALSASTGKAPVQVTLPGTATTLVGSLYFSDSSVDANTGTVRAKAEFANPKNLLWPGQFVQASLQLDTLKDQATMPSAALVTATNGKFVYVLGPDNTAVQKPVKVRYSFGESMAVEGLEASDQIILDGKQNLRPGVKVRVIAPAGKDKPAARAEQAAQPSDKASTADKAAAKPEAAVGSPSAAKAASSVTAAPSKP